MFTFGHSSDNRFIQMSVYRERFQQKCLRYPKFSPPSYVPTEAVTTTATASMFSPHDVLCISMNNRCVEYVLEDNKWTVLVLIVSDDICILDNSPGNTGTTTPWTPFISHETVWKVLRHLNRGGLTIPSSYLNEFVQSSFTVLDHAHGLMRTP